MRAISGKQAQEALEREAQSLEGVRFATADELSFDLCDAWIAIEDDNGDVSVIEVTFDETDMTEKMLELKPRTPELVYVFFREPPTSVEAMDEGPRVDFHLTRDTPCLVFE